MSDAKTELLERIIDAVAAHGMVDRSLREIAEDAGTSHRMVLYHFGSREGLVAAIVDETEARQRSLLRALAATAESPADLVMGLWEQVSSEELRPFVRLFFESLAAGSGTDRLTSAWLEESRDLTTMVGIDFDPVELRLGIAVARGLLIDVLTSGDRGPATESLRRFVEMWDAAR